MTTKHVQETEETVHDLKTKLRDAEEALRGMSPFDSKYNHYRRQRDEALEKLKGMTQYGKPVMEDNGEDDFEEWQEKVRAANPDYASSIEFKGRLENGKTVISAEVPGLDRSFGVYDVDTGRGELLGEDIEEDIEEESVEETIEENSVNECDAGEMLSLRDIRDRLHAMVDSTEVVVTIGDHTYQGSASDVKALLFANFYDQDNTFGTLQAEIVIPTDASDDFKRDITSPDTSDQSAIERLRQLAGLR